VPTSGEEIVVTRSKPVLVGSRGSSLALRQTEEVLDRLRAIHPGIDFQEVIIKTGGDAASEAPLASLGRGIFVKEIEIALLDGKLDMAVHSLKDLPTYLPDGLTIGAVCQRLDPRDVLVNRWACSLEQLPPGARIGTSSPRRAAQLKSLRKDVEVLPIRGNVDTRLRKVTKVTGGDYDGAILAAAGVIRMGLDGEVAQFLSPDDFVPAPGQGALAVEVRRDDGEMAALMSGIEHPPTRREVTAERAFLESLGGGCQVPVGAYGRSAYGQFDEDTMLLTVFLASTDGDRVFKTGARGRASDPHGVASDAYRKLIEGGAGVLLEE
jgi:hydroxymethylbilane synthase